MFGYMYNICVSHVYIYIYFIIYLYNIYTVYIYYMYIIFLSPESDETSVILPRRHQVSTDDNSNNLLRSPSDGFILTTWAIKKTWLFSVWDEIPSYIGIMINLRIPTKQPLWRNVLQVFLLTWGCIVFGWFVVDSNPWSLSIQKIWLSLITRFQQKKLDCGLHSSKLI